MRGRKDKEKEKEVEKTKMSGSAGSKPPASPVDSLFGYQQQIILFLLVGTIELKFLYAPLIIYLDIPPLQPRY